MPVVNLAELTKDNWEAVARTQVRPDQENFVASNLYTIAESQFYPWIRRRVIRSDGFTAGFLAHGRDPETGEYWLHRFMVGADHQGKGIGREAMRQLVEEWRVDPECAVVLVSYDPNNSVAERLYVSFGFVPGEMAEWGERVARLTFHDKRATTGHATEPQSELRRRAGDQG